MASAREDWEARIPMSRKRRLVSRWIGGIALVCLLGASAAHADDAVPSGTSAAMTWEQFRDQLGITDAKSIENTPLGSTGGYAVNYVWLVVAAVLVFWMQAGFALVEAGFTRAKNAVNIFMKNIFDFSFGSLIFWAFGFALMFGKSNGLFGTTGFFLSGYESDTWSYAFLLFQTVFAATAATIVSGAMAERTKFNSYIIYTIFISALVYPVFGSWAWGSLFQGGGWLQAVDGSWTQSLGLPPFIDFAGSTVVHSIGGWAALAGAIALGPRLGKYGADKKPRPIPGHSMTLATLGVFILWMGWFGFNAGSTAGATGGGGEPLGGIGKAFGLIAINTNLAACAGAVGAMLITWLRAGKPDIGMSLNGALAGLVGITAGCANVAPWSAVVIGMGAGIVVVYACAFFEKRGVDDPVGAISVHGVCGALGTVAAGVFNVGGFSWAQIAMQVLGVTAAFVWSFGAMTVLFQVIKRTVGLRVSEQEEIEGLDLTEHGSEAYPQEIGYALSGTRAQKESASVGAKAAMQSLVAENE